MIHRTVPTWQIQDWQDELKNLIQSPETLIERLKLDKKWLAPAEQAQQLFPLRVTESYLRRIELGNPYDPLLLQVLPISEEHLSPDEFVADPLQEAHFNPVPGVIHKYSNRVLLIAATQCAINCRYCFRRHFSYADNHLTRSQWHDALAYIRNTNTLNEVILSGGDPLALGDKQLAWLTEQISNIGHIKRLRIHTRFPIILPSRVTEEFVKAVSHPNLKTIMVIHCNHPQEIDQSVKYALQTLKKHGILLLNQSVLLKNINDNSTILASLSETLFDCEVQPYYLHMLDSVQGASHFHVDRRTALTIYRDLLASLPGYLAPKLVQEIPGESAKTPVGLI